MAAVIIERLDSRQSSWGSDRDATLRYLVTGTEDESLAYAITDAYSPLLYYGLIKNKISVNPGEAPDVWTLEVGYGPMQRPEPGKVQWQFNAGGMTTHITQALAHVASYVASGTAPDHKGAINVHKDGNGELVVDGVDIGGAGGAFTWSETHWIPYASFTPAYVQILYLMAVATPVNNVAWRVWAAKEVRLLGVSGSASGEDNVELNFSFAAEPNITGRTIGAITGIEKKGWDYLWVEYKTEDGGASKTLVKQPLAVHVEQVYGYGNFATLGLANVYWG